MGGGGNRFDLNWKNMCKIRTLCAKSRVWGKFEGICNLLLINSCMFCSLSYRRESVISTLWQILNDIEWWSLSHFPPSLLFFYLDLSLLFSSLLLSQWCTAQHCHLQKTAFLSRTSATTTSRPPAASDACPGLTSRVPASDCARPTAPGQEPLPAAQVRRSGPETRRHSTSVASDAFNAR